MRKNPYGIETGWIVHREAGRNQHGAQLYLAECPGCGARHERTKNALQQSGQCQKCMGAARTAARREAELEQMAKEVTGWEVLGEEGRTKHGAPQYRARCRTCGKEALHTKTNLRKNQTCRSCASAAQLTTHGQSGEPLYAVWGAMRQRCTNPKSSNYRRYGGRGITVTPAWDTYEQFYADMGESYTPGAQLDRIDNDKGYSKENCRWTTPKVNARNRSTARMLTAHGRTQNMAAWAEETGISQSLLTHRIADGWSPEDAVSTPARKMKKRS